MEVLVFAKRFLISGAGRCTSIIVVHGLFVADKQWRNEKVKSSFATEACGSITLSQMLTDCSSFMKHNNLAFGEQHQTLRETWDLSLGPSCSTIEEFRAAPATIIKAVALTVGKHARTRNVKIRVD